MHRPASSRAPVPSIVAVATVLAALIAAPMAAAAVVTVPGDAPTITSALAIAVAGDEIHVDAGTYDAAAGESFPLILGADVAVIGAGVALTVIDAGGAGSVFEVSAPNGGRISGFTLTGGITARGGGVHVMGGTPEIDHNLVLGNGALNAGSGIHATGGSVPWIHHNVVWANFDVDLEDPGDPHGIQVLDSDAVVEHNVVGLTDSNGLIIHGDSNPSVVNNIFIENGLEGVRGRGICHFGGPSTVVAHNMFFGNEIAAILMTGAGDLSAEEANAVAPDDGVYGNIDDDPLFVDAAGFDWALQAESPAIDAGDPASAPDPDGTVADIGAFYFHQSTTSIDGSPVAPGLLLAVAPNPFSLATDLSYSLSADGHVSITVHDVQGRRVAVIVERQAAAGAYTASWDGRTAAGRRAAPGIYFARVALGSVVATQKLVLTR